VRNAQGSHALVLRNASNSAISGNIVDGAPAGANGIHVEIGTTGQTTPTGIAVSGNAVTGVGGHGVVLYQVADFSCTGNAVTAATSDGIHVDDGSSGTNQTKNGIVADNIIANVGTYGIHLLGTSTNINVLNNVVISAGSGTLHSDAGVTNSGTSFFGATPVNQPNTTGTISGFTANAGTAMNSGSTSTGGVGTAAYTFGDLVLALKHLGLLAS
jgi:hypothetical protein